MSAGYVPVSWTRPKRVYDAILLLGVAGYVTLYERVGPALQHVTRPLDEETIGIQAFGSCAFVMLSLILAIGPLARLDQRFLPILYNRRHFGVMTACVAALHGWKVLGWYFSWSPVPATVAVLGADTGFDRWPGFPFIPLGIAAFAILTLLAATSHDFWLAFLKPPVWKAIHMLVYAAYALVVAHVALGELQASSNPLLAVVVALSSATLVTLHLIAGLRGRAVERRVAPPGAGPPWVVATEAVETIPEGRAIIVNLPDSDPVAIFRYDGKLSALTNLCAHQNGPLGEGRIVDGCVTCPWHGFQYRPGDGCAPPPFTERIATYHLRLEGRRLLLDPRPNPPGTPVEPTLLPEGLA